MNARPPRLATWLLAFATPPAMREALLGDLHEQFIATRQTKGRASAYRRYWAQALAGAWHASDIRRTPSHSTRRGFDMTTLWRDIVIGVRTMWRIPSYSVVAVVTMALAIGANTLLFSIANPLVIHALPIKDQDTLGWIFENNAQADVERGPVSAPDFLEWRSGLKSFTELSARDQRGATLTGDGDATRVQVVRVTSNLCDLWGLKSSAGRLFHAGDEDPARPATALLAHHYWRSAFNLDPSAIGRTLYLDGRAVTVIGVVTPDFEVYGNAKIDMWTLLPLDAGSARDDRTLRIVGRLAPGVTTAAATAEIQSLAKAQAAAHPDTNANWIPTVVPTNQAITTPQTWILLGLLGVVVVFVLIIACVNLGNLVLARVVRLGHEFAVRMSLGASRLQLIRPLLVENLLLGVAGGLGGLALAQGGLRVINATAQDDLLKQLSIDGNVLLFTAALSLATPLLFSLWPAIGAGRTAYSAALRAVRSTGGRKTARRRNLLVASQVGLALSMLIVSALVVQTMLFYRHVDVGFSVKDTLTFRVEPPADRYPDDAARAAYARRIVDAVSAVPRVKSAAVVSHLPVFDGENLRTMTGTAHDGQREADRPWVSSFSVTPDLFKSIGIPLLAGRGFAASDRDGAQSVALLSRSAAERYFDNVAAAVGRTVTLHGRGAEGRTVTVVGVVADTRDSKITSVSPQMYLPYEQWPSRALVVVLHGEGAEGFGPDARAAMRALDANVAITQPKLLTTLVQENIGDDLIVTALFVGFGVLALAMAAAGLFGVISYSVNQRQREIGVRLALGAAPSTIRRMVLSEGLRVTGFGVLGGLVLAGLLGKASASVLQGVTASDPFTFGGVTAIVVVVALASVWSPALRAMRVDPARTLRSE